MAYQSVISQTPFSTAHHNLVTQLVLHRKEVPEGIKWELGFACFCTGKMGFVSEKGQNGKATRCNIVRRTCPNIVIRTLLTMLDTHITLLETR